MSNSSAAAPSPSSPPRASPALAAALAAASLAGLPRELLLLLGEELLGSQERWPSGYKARVANLSRLARTSKGFLAVLQPLLYRHVCVTHWADQPATGPQRHDEGTNGFSLLRAIHEKPELGDLVQEITLLLHNPISFRAVINSRLGEEGASFCQSLLRSMALGGDSSVVAPLDGFQWGESSYAMILIVGMCPKAHKINVLNRLRGDWFSNEPLVVPRDHDGVRSLHISGATLNMLSNFLRPLRQLQTLDIKIAENRLARSIMLTNLTKIRITLGQLDAKGLHRIVCHAPAIKHFEYYVQQNPIPASKVIKCLEHVAPNLQVLGISGIPPNFWHDPARPGFDLWTMEPFPIPHDVCEKSITSRFPNLRCLAIHYRHFNPYYQLDRSIATNLVWALPKLQTLMFILLNSPERVSEVPVSFMDTDEDDSANLASFDLSEDSETEPDDSEPRTEDEFVGDNEDDGPPHFEHMWDTLDFLDVDDDDDNHNNHNDEDDGDEEDDDDESSDDGTTVQLYPAQAIAQDLKNFARAASTNYPFNGFHTIREIVLLCGQTERSSEAEQQPYYDFAAEIWAHLSEDFIELTNKTPINLQFVMEFKEGGAPPGWEKN